MIVTYSDDARVTNRKNLGSTSFQTLVDCAEKEIKTLESLTVACGDTGTDFTLSFYDGTTDFFILNELSISANETYVLDNHHVKLKTGQSLRIKASNADQISVVAVTIDAMPKKADVGGFAVAQGRRGN